MTPVETTVRRVIKTCAVVICFNLSSPANHVKNKIESSCKMRFSWNHPRQNISAEHFFFHFFLATFQKIR